MKKLIILICSVFTSAASQAYFQDKSLDMIFDLFFSKAKSNTRAKKGSSKGLERLQTLLREDIEKKENSMGPLDRVETERLKTEKLFFEKFFEQNDPDVEDYILHMKEGVCVGLSLSWLYEEMGLDPKKSFSQFVKFYNDAQKKTLKDAAFLEFFHTVMHTFILQIGFSRTKIDGTHKTLIDPAGGTPIQQRMQEMLGMQVKKDGLFSFSLASDTPNFHEEIQKKVRSILQHPDDKNPRNREIQNKWINISFFTNHEEERFFTGHACALSTKGSRKLDLFYDPDMAPFDVRSLEDEVLRVVKVYEKNFCEDYFTSNTWKRYGDAGLKGYTCKIDFIDVEKAQLSPLAPQKQPLP